jgi:hypothetical protein
VRREWWKRWPWVKKNSEKGRGCHRGAESHE